jgi:hypothetical protein
MNITHISRDTFGGSITTELTSETRLEDVIQLAKEQIMRDIYKYKELTASCLLEEYAPMMKFTLNIDGISDLELDTLPCHYDLYKGEELILSENGTNLTFGGFLIEYIVTRKMIQQNGFIRFEVTEISDPATVRYTGYKILGPYIQWGL